MSQSFLPLIYVLAFVAMILLVQGVAGLLFASRDRSRHINRRLEMLASGMNQSEVYSTLVRQQFSGTGQGSLITRAYQKFAIYCRQAGIEASPQRLLGILAAAIACVWLFGALFLKTQSLGAFFSGALGALLASTVLCGLVFWVWLSRAHQKRMKLMEEQMPLALDVINRALRAGHPVIAAVRLAGEESGDPIGSEFGLIVDETVYGSEFRDALMNFARRSGSPDAHFFAVSVAIQSETGGNLAEILEGLAAVIRSRATLSKRVRALSSEGKASAILLSALPVILVCFMMLTQPSYYTSKFADPAFWPSVAVVSAMYVGGLLMIRRIINFKY